MMLTILAVPGASKMLFKVKSGCLKTGALNLESLGAKNGASCRNLSRSDICSSGLTLCSVGRRKVCRGWGFAWRKQIISRRAADVRQSSDEDPDIIQVNSTIFHVLKDRLTRTAINLHLLPLSMPRDSFGDRTNAEIL